MPYTTSLYFGAVLLGYLAGGIPFGVVVARARGVDITHVGSGNIGATNVGRALGPMWGRLVLALDILKGAGPTLLFLHIARYFPYGDPDEAGLQLAMAAGASAIVGHIASPYLLLRGGKGVATTIGVFGVLLREWLLLPLALWFLVAKVSRYVSLGSMALGLSLPLAAWLRWRDRPGCWMVVAFSGFVAAIVLFRHRANIVRLIQGRERRYGERAGDDDGPPARQD